MLGICIHLLLLFLVFLFFWAHTFLNKSSTEFSMAPMVVRVIGRQNQNTHAHPTHTRTHQNWWSFLSWGLPIIAKSHAFQFSHHLWSMYVFSEYKLWHILVCTLGLPASPCIYEHSVIVIFNLCFGVHYKDCFCSFCLHFSTGVFRRKILFPCTVIMCHSFMYIPEFWTKNRFWNLVNYLVTLTILLIRNKIHCGITLLKSQVWHADMLLWL